MKFLILSVFLFLSTLSFSKTVSLKKVVDCDLNSKVEYLHTVNPSGKWSKVYPENFKIPSEFYDWKLIHSVIDYNQVVYQSCNGTIWDKMEINDFINHWGLDTTGCYCKFFNSFINGAVGKYRGRKSYVIDENNNGDLSDDIICDLSDSINRNHRIVFERYISGKIVPDTVNIKVLAPYINKRGELKGVKYKYSECRKGTVEIEGEKMRVSVFPGERYTYHNKPDIVFIKNKDTIRVTSNQFIKLKHYYKITNVSKKGYSFVLEEYRGTGVPESNQINYIAPDFKINDSLYLHDFKGTNVLLYFWNVKCGMCNKDLPRTYELLSTKKNKDLKVILLSVDKPDESMKFLKDKNINWTNVCIFGNNKIFKEYGVLGFPNQFLIDPDGFIVSEGFFADIEKFVK